VLKKQVLLRKVYFNFVVSWIFDTLICLRVSDRKSNWKEAMVATEKSLNEYLDGAVKHYSSLFKLPSYRKIVLFLAFICIGGGLFSTLLIFTSFDGLLYGFLLGVSLFSTTVLSDCIVNAVVLKGDLIYDLRRTEALSLFCWVIWFLFIFLSAVIGSFFDFNWWIRLSLLGFSAVLISRSTIFAYTSNIKSKARLLTASILQPILCLIPFVALWTKIGYTFTPYFFLFLPFSIIVSLFSSYFFIFLLNRLSENTLGISSMELFKAFLLNWVIGLHAPFEEFLEKLGEKRDVEVSLIRFDSSKPKAVIAVPSVHPGPFKNVGSSLLPSMLKSSLEKELNCVACVPHGLLGHEFDLASQGQTEKVINSVLKSAVFDACEEAKATPFIEVSNGLATACCQIFGKTALLSFTFAPKTTEDFPQELGLFVCQEARKHGLDYCIIVNAHNSIDGTVNIDKTLDALKQVAVECLEKAASQKKSPFEIGAATVFPNEFSLQDGMGPGGITAVVVKVGEQKTAYIVIDGNNMISGLREKILSAVRSMSVEAGEVFTTDTHSVNAVILGERGYHPIGEVINHEKLIKHVKNAVTTAISNLEPAKSACRRITISDITVIGEKLLEKLCFLVDKTIQRAKKIVVPIFAVTGLILMLFLLLV